MKIITNEIASHDILDWVLTKRKVEKEATNMDKKNPYLFFSKR